MTKSLHKLEANPSWTIVIYLYGIHLSAWHPDSILMEIYFVYSVRVSSRPADAAIARLIQGTKVLTSGGPDKLFQQTFGGFLGEKLLQPCACYISTNSGPLIGTLYISTKRLAFCSDSLLCHHPFSLQQHECVYYKVPFHLIA